MTMAQYVVRQSEHGYELIRMGPGSRPNPLWTIGGTLAALTGFKRRTLPGLVLAGIGAAMIYYANEGTMHWGRRAESSGSSVGRGRGAGQTATTGSDGGEMMEVEGDLAAAQGEVLIGPSYQHDGQWPARQVPRDRVEEASMQSFPASDPPAY